MEASSVGSLPPGLLIGGMLSVADESFAEQTSQGQHHNQLL